MGGGKEIPVSERLAQAQERHRSLTLSIQDLQLQQQELERRRQELLAELLRLEGEIRILQELDSAKETQA